MDQENLGAPADEQPAEAVGLVAPESQALTEVGQPAPDEAPTEAGSAEAPPAEGEAWPDEFARYFPELAAKFKDPIALARSYVELERQFHAERQAQGRPEGQGPSEAEGEADEDADAAFLDALAERPRAAIRELAHEVALKVAAEYFQAYSQARDTWEALKAKYPDAPKHEQALAQMLPVVQALLQQNVPLQEAVERVYAVVAGAMPTPRRAVEQAKAEAREQVLQQVRATTVERGSGAAAPPANATPEQQIVAEIVAAEGGRPVLRPL